MSAEERDTLERWARRPTTAQALAMRARVVLPSAAGQPILHVARDEDISWATAREWRRRFLRGGWTGCSMSRAPVHPPITRCGGRTRADPDARNDAARRDALEHALDGAASGLSQSAVAPHLAGLRAAAAPHRDLQAVDRPALHRESARHRRPLSRSRPIARWCCASTRRVADPSARSHRSHSCRCGRAKSSGGPTTTCATAPRRCSPRST